MAEPALRLIDTGSGEVVPLETSNNQLLERVNLLEGDLSNRERQERKLLRRIAQLEADKERDRETCQERKTVEEIFREWQGLAGKHKSKLTPDRFDVIRARIRDGYSRVQIQLAIEGIVFDPFTTEARNGRTIKHNDIELCLRTGKGLEAYALRAPRRKQ